MLAPLTLPSAAFVAALGGHGGLLKADMLAREWNRESQLLEKTSRPRLWVGQEWGDPEPR